MFMRWAAWLNDRLACRLFMSQDGRAKPEHATAASYGYVAHLRHELTPRLGVRWREVVNGLSEIEGFTPEQLHAFSTGRSGHSPAAYPQALGRRRTHDARLP